MSKPIKAKVRLQLPAGSANPAPPVGSTLGPHGINLMKFCTEFNNATKDKKGDIIRIIITIYTDKTFDILFQASPVTALIKQRASITKGASKTGAEIVGSLTKAQVEEIAKIKLNDMTTTSLEAAIKNIKGSARSMGVKIV